MVSEFGIGSAVVTLRSMSRNQIAQVNSVAVMFGFLAMLVSFALAHVIGMAFSVPQVTSIILALSPTLFLGGLQTVPTSLLQKHMRFKLLAVAEGVQTALVAVVTVGARARGCGLLVARDRSGGRLHRAHHRAALREPVAVARRIARSWARR